MYIDDLKYLVELSHSVSPYVVGAEGNTSKRVNDGFYIKSSGCSLVRCTEEDFILCDIDGNSRNKSQNPSMESSFHSWIYKNLDVEYIAHTHPSNTLKILCSREAENFANKRLFPDQVVYNGHPSCIVDYFHPGEILAQAISHSIVEYKKKYKSLPKIVLLKNHGVITFGNTIRDCLISTEICEKSAEVFLGSLFGANYLTDVQIQLIKNDKKEIWRQEKISRK